MKRILLQQHQRRRHFYSSHSFFAAKKRVVARQPFAVASQRVLFSSTTKTHESNNNDDKYDVKIVEVGPRDGLQNEPQIVSVDDKVALISKLAHAGCRHIETGSFVHPKWVPSMANTGDVMTALAAKQQHNDDDVQYSCLVPNAKGLQQALQHANVHEVAVFAAASQAFSQRNLGCSIEESMQRFRDVVHMARQQERNVKKKQIRGYLSCIVACPYQGKMSPVQVAKVAEQMVTELDLHELSLGDTIGVATPADTQAVLREVQAALGGTNTRLAVHFHDTYGQALTNIYVAMEQFDINVIDASVAGLGGCPYAKGASGNVATEDVVYMLHGMGVKTGIDLERLVHAGDFITNQVLKTHSRSKVGQAMLAAAKEDDEQ